MEKRLEVQSEMALGFVDLEKAYDAVLREMVMVTCRKQKLGWWKGCTRERREEFWLVLEEFSMDIGLRQGSALSPLKFIMVMELVSRKVSLRGSMGTMLHADDLAVVVESGRQMWEVLGEWKDGLKMSMEKTEVMWFR